MRKRGLFAAVSACLMLLAFGGSASAAVITFDERPQLQQMKLPEPGEVAVPFGTYLAAARCGITEIGTGKVRISAETTCYRTCASVYAAAYLYQVNDGTSSYITNTAATNYDTNYCGVSKDCYVERFHYYQVRGGHAIVAYDGTQEPATSATNIVYVN